MAFKSLEDADYQVIKAAILDRNDNMLSYEQQEKLSRTICAGQILDRYPSRKHAVRILQKKYPQISLKQAYADINLAVRLFNSMYTFDYQLWHSWLINSITKQIKLSMEQGDVKGWASGNMSLLKAIGEKPIEDLDPKLTEKHQFVIVIQNNKQETNINLDTIDKLPFDSRKQITDTLVQDIDDAEAAQIMES
jgi:hypothetical protein